VDSSEIKDIELWEQGTEKIAWTGLFGDPSVVIKFTLWKSAGLAPIIETSY
jgi:hypothetical protein